MTKRKADSAMKLKTRLTIAFISIVFGSVILMGAALLGLLGMKTRSVQKEYGVEFSVGYILNAVQTVNESTSEIWEKMKDVSEHDPDKFLLPTYLEELNTELADKLSYLVVLKDEQLLYQGDAGTDWDEHLEQLLRYEDKSEGTSYYVGGNQKSMVKQINIRFTDGTSGCACIVTSLASIVPQFRIIVSEILLAVVLVLVITSLAMTVWIYNGISRPVTTLREAANRITAGDYDFTVEACGEDEISDLCRDFEEMRRRLQTSEEQKEKYDAENRELISNISHDLKTPITTVKGYVEGIMDGVADTPEKMDRYIKTIYNKANDMDRLINELTFYSKIDTNRIPYHFTKLNVAEFFDDCAEEENLELEERGISFTYENKIDPGIVIIGDPEQLKRVIDNIIGNSVKYIDKPKGKIALRILDAGDFVQVELEDNGKGIDTKDLANIFDRFYRTDASRNSAQGGSGIGLSIVRKIIEDHSGKIWATSTLGRGTVMHFVIRKYQETRV